MNKLILLTVKKLALFDDFHLLTNIGHVTWMVLHLSEKVQPKVSIVPHVMDKTWVHSLCQYECSEKHMTAGVMENLVLVTLAVCGFLRVKKGWEPVKKWTMPRRGCKSSVSSGFTSLCSLLSHLRQAGSSDKNLPSLSVFHGSSMQGYCQPQWRRYSRKEKHGKQACAV